MKLRYYLRGLAVGILLTTLILAIANAGNKPLTDAQIRQRALALGMIDADSQKLSSLGAQAGDKQESKEPTGSTQPTGTEPAKDSDQSGSNPSTVSANQPESQTPASDSHPTDDESMASDQSAGTESSKTGSQSESNAPTGSAGQPESSVSSAASTPSESDNANESSVGDGTTAFTLRIVGGDSSYSVSKKLAAAGLVEDAAAFDAFLCDNGYSRSIHTGTYEILPGTTQEEIAKMIAG
ncbi:MAG: hypothetical protein NC092_10720 [Butyrivibrio sp.]|nr:hypothetical protein [Muribaculum sp.]MCM1553153.1 hypothetical protein [Butyrivibrio sp.]